MKLYYDFHIHTALSPCGDNEMTPNNIVNMAILNALDCIAITDHNTIGNVLPVMKVAEEAGLLVVPGVEVETMEEVHTVCLFGCIEAAVEFGEIIESKMPPIKNKKEIFGEQLYLDAFDNVVKEHENLLVIASMFELYELVETVKSLNGVCIPAHVDRSSYSILSNLGFVPADLDVSILEFTKKVDPIEFMHNKKPLFGKKFKAIQSSDAHYLENIGERTNFLNIPKDKVSVKDIISFLGN